MDVYENMESMASDLLYQHLWGTSLGIFLCSSVPGTCDWACPPTFGMAPLDMACVVDIYWVYYPKETIVGDNFYYSFLKFKGIKFQMTKLSLR